MTYQLSAASRQTEGVAPGAEGEGVGHVDVVEGEHLPGFDLALDDHVADEADGDVVGVVLDEDGFAPDLEVALASFQEGSGWDGLFGDDADAGDGVIAVVEQDFAVFEDVPDGDGDFEMAEMVVADHGVVGAGAQLQIFEGGCLDLIVFGGDEDAGGEFFLGGGTAEQVVADGLAEFLGFVGEADGAFVDVFAFETKHAAFADGGAQAIGDEDLFDLDFGAVGEAGDLIEGDAPDFGPILHVFEGRIEVEEAFEVAIDEGFEAHGDEVVIEGGEGAGLVAFGFGDEAAGGEEAAGGDVELGVHGDDGAAGGEGVVDDFGGVDRVAIALDNEIALVDEFLGRIGVDAVVGEVIQVSAGQYGGDDHVVEAVDGFFEAIADEAGADDADFFLVMMFHV